jgi:hypothetical protein
MATLQASQPEIKLASKTSKLSNHIYNGPFKFSHRFPQQATPRLP